MSFLNMELGDFFRLLKKKTGGATSSEAASDEARVRLVGSADGQLVEVFSQLDGRRLFAVEGRLAGTLGKFSEGADRGSRQLTVNVPLELEGERFSMKVVYIGSPEAGAEHELTLTRASRSLVPPDFQMLEFLFTRGEHELRYIFELPEGVEVSGFVEVVDVRPIFLTIPPVAQMAAFLRAMTNQRRTTLARLEDITRSSGSPESLELVGEFGRLYPGQHELLHPVVDKLHRLLKACGRDIHPGALSAFCYFIDLERGVLDVEALRTAAAALQDPPLTELAAYAVKQFFCVEVPNEDWDRTFELDAESCQEQFRRLPFPRIIRSLRQSSQSRSHLEILSELAKESKSKRVEAFVQAAREVLPEGQFRVNDEQDALRTLLAESGRQVHPNTLSALCLFVDVEVGLLTEEGIADVAPGGAGMDTSMYALVAVSGAFDLPLRGLALESPGSDGGRAFLANLVRLTQGYLIAQFVKAGEKGYWMEHLYTEEDVQTCLNAGLQFTGKVLARLPVIDQLNELDLEVFLRGGDAVTACFAADYDRAILWRKMSGSEIEVSPDPAAERKGRFTFIQGFTAFSFNRLVVAQLVNIHDYELLGQSRVVTADLDMRGNHHYRLVEHVASLEDLQPKPGLGLTWTSKRVVYPDIRDLPPLLHELGQEPLLGRAEALIEEARTLDWVQRGLTALLTELPTYLDLDGVDGLREGLLAVLKTAAIKTVLGPIMDAQTRDGLAERLANDDRLRLALYTPLAELADEVPDYVALEVMFALCLSEAVTLERWFKHYDERPFQRLLRSRLTEMLDHESAAVRSRAVHLLPSRIQDHNDRLVVEYELHQAQTDPDSTVVDAAYGALTRLAMTEVVPLPVLVKVDRIDEGVVAKPVEAEPEYEGEGPLSGRLLTDTARDIEAFLNRLLEGDEALVKDRNVARRLERVQQAARELRRSDGGFDAERLRQLAHWLESWNFATDQAGLLDSHRYWCLVDAERTGEFRGAIWDSWRVFAMAQGHRLSQLLLDHSPSELFLDYSFFISESGPLLEQELGSFPFLGGPGRPQTIYHQPPRETVGIYRRGKESSFVESTQEVAPVFLDLLEQVAHNNLDQIRLIRVRRAQGMPLETLEAHLPVFDLEKSLEPAGMEILQPGRYRFAPLMHHLSLTREQVGEEEDDWEDFEALLELFRQSERGGVTPDPVEIPESEHVAGVASPEPERARPSFKDLALSVTRVFNLPEQYTKQVVNILLDVGAQSVYDL